MPQHPTNTEDIVDMKAQDHFLILSVLVVTLCLALGACKREPPALAAIPPPVVMVSPPVEREITDYYEYTGRTAAVEAVEVRARVSGYLVKVNFREGSVVKKGDLLFQIDPRPFQAMLDEAKGQVAQWEAKLARAEADVTRDERLLPKGAASQKDLDQAVADRGEARAAIQSARGAVDRAALDLEFTRVTAPINGRISRHLIDEGNLVTMNSTLLTTIVSVDPMYAYFDVDEHTVLRVRQLIREGKARSARDSAGCARLCWAWPTRTGFPHQGTINFVDNQVNPKTGTLRVRGRLPQQGRGRSLPAISPASGVPIGQPHKALLVTERAIDTDQGQKIVYVVNDKNEVVSRPVRLGALARRPAGDHRRPEAGRAGDRQRPATGPAGHDRRAEAGGHADPSQIAGRRSNARARLTTEPDLEGDCHVGPFLHRPPGPGVGHLHRDRPARGHRGGPRCPSPSTRRSRRRRSG